MRHSLSWGTGAFDVGDTVQIPSGAVGTVISYQREYGHKPYTVRLDESGRDGYYHEEDLIPVGHYPAPESLVTVFHAFADFGAAIEQAGDNVFRVVIPLPHLGAFAVVTWDAVYFFPYDQLNDDFAAQPEDILYDVGFTTEEFTPSDVEKAISDFEEATAE